RSRVVLRAAEAAELSASAVLCLVAVEALDGVVRVTGCLLLLVGGGAGFTPSRVAVPVADVGATVQAGASSLCHVDLVSQVGHDPGSAPTLAGVPSTHYRSSNHSQGRVAQLAAPAPHIAPVTRPDPGSLEVESGAVGLRSRPEVLGELPRAPGVAAWRGPPDLGCACSGCLVLPQLCCAAATFACHDAHSFGGAGSGWSGSCGSSTRWICAPRPAGMARQMPCWSVKRAQPSVTVRVRSPPSMRTSSRRCSRGWTIR